MERKTFSISLICAIPIVVAFGLVCSIYFYAKVTSEDIDPVSISLFGMGGLLGLSFFSGKSFPRTRVFLHELKHAVMVIGTGNRITDFHFEKNTGHVQFKISSRKLRFRPFISLAPYYFPLLSLPVFLISLLMWDKLILAASFLLGLTLSIDLITAWRDLHPNQTDLKIIRGGFPVFGTFLGFSNLSWSMLCLLWATGGNDYLWTLGKFIIDLFSYNV